MMNTWTRRLAMLAVVVALGSLLALPTASAAQTPIQVTPASVEPGQQFTVSGPADCIKGSILTISVTGLGLTATVSGDAAWEVPFTVPTNAAPATYPVVVDNEECTFADGSLVVVEPATTTTTTTAAPTTVAPTTTEPAAQAEAVTASPTFTG